MEIIITENVTNALIAGTSTTVTLSYVGVQGPPGTVGTAAYATNAGTSVFATNAGTSVFATSAGTSVFATNAGTSVFATTSDTATYATTSGTATYATTSGTAVNISGTILASQVVGTAADLADNVFTGKQTLPASSASAAPLNIGNGSQPTIPVNGDLWMTSSGLQFKLSTSATPSTAATLAANTFVGKQTLPKSTITAASLNIQNGTAPTSPATGDLYAVDGSLIYQSSLGGQTLAFLSSNITGNAATAGTATYATTAGTAVNISGTITATQVTGTAAALTSANTFTVGGQVIKTGADATAGLAIWRNSATQTADLLTIYQSNGSTVLAKIAASGALTVGAGGVGANQVVIDPTGSNNVFAWSPASVGNGVSGSIDQYGKLILGGANATTASLNIPSTATAPSSPATGDMWFSSGNVQFQTASGLRTFAYLQAANIFTTGEQVIKTGADATRGLAIWRNSTSQTADLLAILSSTGSTTLAAFGPTGALTVSPSSGTAATINAAVSASAAIGMVIQPNTGGGGGYAIQFNNTGSTIASHVQSDGAFGIRTFGSGFSGSLSVGAGSAGTIGAVIRGVSGQTADLQQWQATGGTVLGGRNAAGQTYAGSTASQVGSTTTALTSAAYTSATVAVFTYAGTSLVQVGQTVTVANVTGGAYNGTWVVSAVTSTTFTVLGSGFTNNAGTGGTFKLSAVGSFTAGTAAITPIVVKAAASQTASLQEWQDSTGAIAAAISAGGNLRTGAIQAADGNTVMVFAGGSRNFGILTVSASYGGGSGVMFVGNATTVPSTNPTGGGILYAEGGALKWRGSSGTVTTIAAA